MFSPVYGLSYAAMHGWHTPSTWAFLVAGAALLIASISGRSRAAQPLLPPGRPRPQPRRRLPHDAGHRGRHLPHPPVPHLLHADKAGLSYSAIITAVTLLPLVVPTAVATNVGNIMLILRFGPRPLVIVGLLSNAAGTAWLTRIGVNSGYASALLGPIVVTGVGHGTHLRRGAPLRYRRVAPRDAGMSACISTGQQLGGSISIALLNTIAASATASCLASHRPAPQLVQLGAIHAYTTVFWWCTGIFAVGAGIRGVLCRPGPLIRFRGAPPGEPYKTVATAPA